MKLGLISDTHIPNRANKIPEEFLNWFEDEKVDVIIHCGDVTDLEVLEELRRISDVKVVRGNTDYHDFPRSLELEINDWKIFVFHSSEIYPRGDLKQLYEIGKENNVDIVIFGHTHVPLFIKMNHVYLVNPGSATGVYSGEIFEAPKSVAILELSRDINIKFKLLYR